jgi:hypothetical protein
MGSLDRICQWLLCYGVLYEQRYKEHTGSQVLHRGLWLLAVRYIVKKEKLCVSLVIPEMGSNVGGTGSYLSCRRFLLSPPNPCRQWIFSISVVGLAKVVSRRNQPDSSGG